MNTICKLQLVFQRSEISKMVVCK